MNAAETHPAGDFSQCEVGMDQISLSVFDPDSIEVFNGRERRCILEQTTEMRWTKADMTRDFLQG